MVESHQPVLLKLLQQPINIRPQRHLIDLPDFEVRIAESNYGHETRRVGVHTVRVASRL